MEYLGVQVNVVPIEEILVQKMIMQRVREWQDEEDIKLLKKQKISRKALFGAFDRWGVFKGKQKKYLEKYKRILNI